MYPFNGGASPARTFLPGLRSAALRAPEGLRGAPVRDRRRLAGGPSRACNTIKTGPPARPAATHTSLYRLSPSRRDSNHGQAALLPSPPPCAHCLRSGSAIILGSVSLCQKETPRSRFHRFHRHLWSDSSGTHPKAVEALQDGAKKIGSWASCLWQMMIDSRHAHPPVSFPAQTRRKKHGKGGDHARQGGNQGRQEGGKVLELLYRPYNGQRRRHRAGPGHVVTKQAACG